MSHRRHNNSRSKNNSNKTWSNNNNNNNNNNNRNNNSTTSSNAPKLRPCKNFMGGGTVAPNLPPCSNPTCKFAHVIQCYFSLQLSSKKNNPVLAVNVWKDGGRVNVFTGGRDGVLRLWDAGNGFNKVFEHKSGTSITSSSLQHNRLFVAYETMYDTSKGTIGEEGPGREKVGGIQMWDLGNAGATPVEFQVSWRFFDNGYRLCERTTMWVLLFLLLFLTEGGNVVEAFHAFR